MIHNNLYCTYLLHMLIAEEEILFLPKHTFRSTTGIVTSYLWQHRMDQCALEDFSHIHYPFLPYNEYDAFSHKRKIERLSIGIIASQILGTEVKILRNREGRPTLQNHNANISISHTRNLYCLSISEARHGMDVEHWGNVAYKVRKKFLHPDEIYLIDKLLPLFQTKERAATFLWSAKEAAYKYKGGEDSLLLRDIRLHCDDIRHLRALFPNSHETAIISYEVYPSCVLTFCMKP